MRKSRRARRGLPTDWPIRSADEGAVVPRPDGWRRGTRPSAVTPSTVATESTVAEATEHAGCRNSGLATPRRGGCALQAAEAAAAHRIQRLDQLRMALEQELQRGLAGAPRSGPALGGNSPPISQREEAHLGRGAGVADPVVTEKEQGSRQHGGGGGPKRKDGPGRELAERGCAKGGRCLAKRREAVLPRGDRRTSTPPTGRRITTITRRKGAPERGGGAPAGGRRTRPSGSGRRQGWLRRWLRRGGGHAAAARCHGRVSEGSRQMVRASVEAAEAEKSQIGSPAMCPSGASIWGRRQKPITAWLGSTQEAERIAEDACATGRINGPRAAESWTGAAVSAPVRGAADRGRVWR